MGNKTNNQIQLQIEFDLIAQNQKILFVYLYILSSHAIARLSNKF